MGRDLGEGLFGNVYESTNSAGDVVAIKVPNSLGITGIKKEKYILKVYAIL
jgi:hypothetical protein